ncbi:MAG: hypothetical protein ACEQSB_04670 [Undibacterium sp.]
MKKKPGFILITTVFILLALSVTLTLALANFSLGSTGRTLALERGERVLALAEGCTEEVLFQVRENPSFDDTTVPLGNETCDTDIQVSGNEYTVRVSVTSEGHTRGVTTKFTRGTERLVLSSWKVE